MKSVILGMIGALIALYTAVIALGIYGIYARKDELDNSLAEVMESVMLQHYSSGKVSEFISGSGAGGRDEAVEREIREELALRLAAESKLDVTVTECDMEQGILAVRVRESFVQLNGKDREVTAEKVLIADVR